MQGHRGGVSDQQVDIFKDFNGFAPELKGDFRKRLEFWQHEGNWTNRLIHGDSKLVLASLMEKELMAGKAQMLYIDPPYGINFSTNTQNSSDSSEEQADSAQGAPREPEAVTAFRDTWRLGIHSYLGYLADRICLAHKMLAESGSCFVQISERNVHFVRCLLDDMFGMDNFVSQISYKVSSGTQKGKGLRRISDYLLWYAKDIEKMKFNRLYVKKMFGKGTTFTKLELANGERKSMTTEQRENIMLIPPGSRPYRVLPLHSARRGSGGDREPRLFEGKLWSIPEGSQWRHTKQGFEQLVRKRRIVSLGTSLGSVYYFDDFPYSELTTTWQDTSPELSKKYIVQTSTLPVQRCMLMSTDPGDLVVDITCGGGTIPIVAEEWGRRWIAMDTSRVSIMLTRKRLIGASLPTYMLADTEEGQKKIAEDDLELGIGSASAPAVPVIPRNKFYPDVREGFVCKRAYELRVGLVARNREPVLRTLYDEPYFSKLVDARVSGPFTVEQLMPHAPLPNSPAKARKRALTEATSRREDAVQFVCRVLEHLKASGISLRYREQRVTFDEIEMREGFDCVQAEGRYHDQRGAECVAGIAVGPQYHPLTQEFVDSAVKEGNQIGGRDVLFVLCFNVQGGGVSIGKKKYGSLPVNIVDMSGELNVPSYAPSSKARIFNIFGQPDIVARASQKGDIWGYRNGKWHSILASADMNDWSAEDEVLADGEMQIKLRGMDFFDPTSGNFACGDANDVACMFLDTNFDGESFFARHAYFPGETGQSGTGRRQKTLYEQIKNDLRLRDIPDEAWNALHTKKSFRFAIPEEKELDTRGAVERARIAVKVISVRGIEAMCVIPIDWGI